MRFPPHIVRLDSGGEKYLPFAKRRLELLSKTQVFARQYYVIDDVKITVWRHHPIGSTWPNEFIAIESNPVTNVHVWNFFRAQGEPLSANVAIQFYPKGLDQLFGTLVSSDPEFVINKGGPTIGIQGVIQSFPFDQTEEFIAYSTAPSIVARFSKLHGALATAHPVEFTQLAAGFAYSSIGGYHMYVRPDQQIVFVKIFSGEQALDASLQDFIVESSDPSLSTFQPFPPHSLTIGWPGPIFFGPTVPEQNEFLLMHVAAPGTLMFYDTGRISGTVADWKANLMRFFIGRFGDGDPLDADDALFYLNSNIVFDTTDPEGRSEDAAAFVIPGSSTIIVND